ncbi:hypothetical protein JW766_01845 [Candidatus Dojkabacteria bacterium]|nr:hypothetical protein [Candidatus Dojkabacteria bacterium]
MLETHEMTNESPTSAIADQLPVTHPELSQDQVGQILGHFFSEGYGTGLDAQGVIVKFVEYFELTREMYAENPQKAFSEALYLLDVDYGQLIAGALSKASDRSLVFHAIDSIASSLSTGDRTDLRGLSSAAVFIGLVNNYTPLVEIVQENPEYSKLFTPIMAYKESYGMDMTVPAGVSLEIAVVDVSVSLAEQLRRIIEEALARLRQLDEELKRLFSGSLRNIQTRLSMISDKLGRGMPLDVLDRIVIAQTCRAQRIPIPSAL